MTPPHSSSGSKSFAAYVVMYAIALSTLVLDIQRGGVHFTVLGIVSSILLTGLIAYRMAQAMAGSAGSSTNSRLEPVSVRIPQQGQAA
jgi:hypothetical protein